MGRIGNALKRGLTGEKKKKKPIAGKVAGGCLGSFVMLVVIIICCVNIFAKTVSDWVSTAKSAFDSVAGVAKNEASQNASNQAIADAQQQVIANMTIEQKVVNEVELPPMSEQMRKDALLQITTVEDLVNGTLKPFGEAGDGDERFDSVTIKTEIIQKVKIHPSKEEIEKYRSDEYNSMYAAKQQAIIDAIAAAATDAPSTTPDASGTPAPTGAAGKGNVLNEMLNGAKDVLNNITIDNINKGNGVLHDMVGKQLENISDSIKNNVQSENKNTSGKKNNKNSKTNTSAQGSNPAKKADAGTPAPTPQPVNTPKPTAAPVNTPAPTPKPGASGTPAPSGTKAPSGTSMPTATPTPIPTPTWDASDQAELDRRVQKYIDDNTRIEERKSFVGRTIDGENVRAYLNSFHTPWQSNYSEAAFIAMFDYGYEQGSVTAIQPEVVTRVFEYGNMLEYKLYLDYWANKEYWETEEFLYDARESVFGGEKTAYEEYVNDYSAEPIIIDEHTDLIEEKGFVPLPLFNHISDWVIDTTYGNKAGGYNAYGIPIQLEKNYETSVSFNAFSEGLELTNLDLRLFASGYERMPECEDQYRRLSMVVSLYEPSFYDCSIVISDFAHLAGGDTGDRAAYAAMEVVQKKPTYSKESRESVTSYDCSSLVSRVYDSIGIHDFHPGYSFDTAALLKYFEQHNLGIVTGGWPEDESILMPGDVIMWAKPSSDKYKHVYHTGLWIGDGYIVDASTSLNHVVYRQMWSKDQVIMIARPSLLNLQ